MVVILIESPNLLCLLRALQLSVYVTILGAVVCLYCQTAVGPQLPLAPVPVRGLHKGYQLRGPKRSYERNLTQNFHCLMSAALGLQLSSHGAPQGQQSIQLLIEQFCASVYPYLFNLLQPLLAMAPAINLLPLQGIPQLRYSALSLFITRFKSLLTTS